MILRTKINKKTFYCITNKDIFLKRHFSKGSLSFMAKFIISFYNNSPDLVKFDLFLTNLNKINSKLNKFTVFKFKELSNFKIKIYRY